MKRSTLTQMKKDELIQLIGDIVLKIDDVTKETLDLDPCNDGVEIINSLRESVGLQITLSHNDEYYPDVAVCGKHIPKDAEIVSITLSDGTVLDKTHFSRNNGWDASFV